MSNEFEDSSLPSGSFDLTILETGQRYVADNFAFDVDSTLLQTMDAQGRVNRQKVIQKSISGSADVQLEDRDTDLPATGHTFAVDADRDNNAEPYFVAKPGRSFSADGEFKAKIGIQACVAPLVYGSAGQTTAQLATGLTFASGGAITSFTLGAYLPKGLTLAASPYTSSTLPTGLSLNASTGVVSGTPSAAGTSYVSFYAEATATEIRNGEAVTVTRKGKRVVKIIIT